MGWSSGSELLCSIARGMRQKSISPQSRKKIYELLVDELANHDCDTLDECEGVDRMLDEVLLDKVCLGEP